jgi:hypothetical protein
MKWVNFQAWTDFHSPSTWILPAYIRVDASSTLKTHQLNTGKQKNSLQSYEFQVHESTSYEKTNLVSFVHLKRSSLSTGWTNPFKRKKHKTLENCNFVIHFSKSISTSPLSHNEQRSVFQKYISTRLPSNFWPVSFRSWLFLKETKSITAPLRTNYLYTKP